MAAKIVGRHGLCLFVRILGLPLIGIAVLSMSGCASPPPQTASLAQDGRGVQTIDYGAASIQAGAPIGNSFTEALAGPTRDRPKVYGVRQMRAFNDALASFLAATPELHNGIAASPDTAEAKQLRADFATCVAAEGEDSCYRRLGSTDYDNILGEPETVALSANAALLRPRLGKAEKARLEATLTAMLEQIRSHTSRDVAAPLKPVKVVVGPPGDLNIQASFGSDHLVVGEDAIRHIYLRAFHRAIHGIRANQSEFELFENCDLCSSELQEANAYSLSLGRYLHLSRGLPGLRVHLISNSWFAKAVRHGCGAQLDEDLRDKLDEIESAREQDLRQMLEPSEIRRLAGCATDGSVRLRKADVDNYLADIPTEEDEDRAEDGISSFGPLLVELSSMNAALSAELAKSFMFLMAHESYHLWVSGNAGPQAEFDADAHAVKTFLATFPEVDADRWLGSMRTMSDQEPSDLFQAFLGRDPVVLLREMYGGIKAYEQDQLHPPLEQRIARISEEIASGRLKFTCEMIDQVNAAVSANGGLIEITSSASGSEVAVGAPVIPECTPKKEGEHESDF